MKSEPAAAAVAAGHSNEVKLLIAIGGIYACFITFAINTEVRKGVKNDAC